MNKERPIVFNATLVQALLAGTKTQTRELVKLPYEAGRVESAPPGSTGQRFRFWASPEPKHLEKINPFVRCPHGQVGDLFWVRERVAFLSSTITQARSRYVYEADASAQTRASVAEYDQWRPSVQMPREAARLLLQITNVRCERLQDISEDDARAEGATSIAQPQHPLMGWDDIFPSARQHFHQLWSQRRGKDSWAQNPWVWVISFVLLPPPTSN